MIPPRLSADQAVTTAVVHEAAQVPEGDPRLRHLDEGLCRCVMDTTAEAWFVAWPDGALGFAVLWPEERIAERLIEAYGAARDSLELFALDCFFLYDPAMPH